MVPESKTQSTPGVNPFPDLRFNGTLRPSQREAVAIARKQLAEGETRLHIVAPPGSGKTILGLALWATIIRRPALVLSPNSAIQAQWVERARLFTGHDAPELTSTDPARPALLTSLTYQSVTLPARGGADLDREALDCWVDTLVASGEAEAPDEAQMWIEDLARHNPDYHAERMGAYRKRVRDELAKSGEAFQTLHASSRQTIEQLREANVGLLILDECHHLMGHWGRVLRDIHELFNAPVVVGLTATPPERSGRDPADIERYDQFFGPVDYEIPVPALVRDGVLAPFQDLAYFVRPTADELGFIANTDDALIQLIETLCVDSDSDDAPTESLIPWLLRILETRALPGGTAPSWAVFAKRDPALAETGPQFLRSRGIPLPPNVPAPPPTSGNSELLATVAPILDRYIRHRLRPSPDPRDHAMATTSIQRLRMLGTQITETGMQACASPVSRVLAYTHAKAEALQPILTTEMATRGDTIRAVIVTDYERTSAVTPEIAHLFDEEAGGAIAAFRSLLDRDPTDKLDPVLVTGSTVLVDDDLAERFLEEAQTWLSARNLEITLSYTEEAGFMLLTGHGQDWCPRNYVALITELFQRGITRCLVGTRGLLGEGWDASKTNVLIDLTAITSSMSVNQLRGRSIRLDPDAPEKLASNWDVICIAPEFCKGLADYQRFRDRHATLFGVTDDGVIEKGVGHVHAAFTELKPEGVEGAVGALNTDMLTRAARHDRARTLWRIGEPFHPDAVHAVEQHGGGGGGGLPPFPGKTEAWSDLALTQAIGNAILESLVAIGQIRPQRHLHAGERAGGYVRVFLQDATADEAELFATCLAEALGPLRDARYIIPRRVTDIEETWISRLLPEVVADYFRYRSQRLAMWHPVPTVLATKRNRVNLYQCHWNAHVSPGEAVFTQRGEGVEILQQAQQAGLEPTAVIRYKQVWE